MRRIVGLILLTLVVTGCSKKSEVASDTPVPAKVVTRSVTLFYESPEMLLSPETRNVPLPDTPAAIPIVVRELLKGSANASVPRLLPPDCVVRGVYSLPDGTAIVDLGGQTLASGWSTGSHQEMMALYSIVSTITTNFPNIQRVRVLVNGQVAETLAGHISLDKPLRVMPSLIRR